MGYRYSTKNFFFVLLGAMFLTTSSWSQELPIPTPQPALVAPISGSSQMDAKAVKLESQLNNTMTTNLQLESDAGSTGAERIILGLKYKDEDWTTEVEALGLTDGNLGKLRLTGRRELGHRAHTFAEWKREHDEDTVRSGVGLSILGPERWSLVKEIRLTKSGVPDMSATTLTLDLPLFERQRLMLLGSKTEESKKIGGELNGHVTDDVTIGVSVTSEHRTISPTERPSWQSPKVESSLRWTW